MRLLNREYFEGLSFNYQNYKISEIASENIFRQTEQPKYDNDINLEFSIKMLLLFKKSSNLAEKVTLNLYPENPLKLDIILNENNGSFLFFYLAPKLSE